MFGINRLKAERDNAEERATIHFRKLNRIENIIKEGEKNKDPYFNIVDKIKEELAYSSKQY